MARKPKSPTGAGDSIGGESTRQQIALARATPDITAAVTSLQPVGQTMRYIVGQLTINNDTDRLVIADFIRQIKTGAAVLEGKFGEIIDPLWVAITAARKWKNEVLAPYVEAEGIAKGKLGDWDMRQLNAQREENERRERVDREQREKQRAAELAANRSVDAPAWVGGGAPGFAVGQSYAVQPPYQYDQHGTLVTPSTHPAYYADPMAAVRSPAPLTGVSTSTNWTVEIDNDAQASYFLIQNGMAFQSHNGIGDFVRLDAGVLKAAVKGDGVKAVNARALLALVPGVRVVQTATVTARQYE